MRFVPVFLSMTVAVAGLVGCAVSAPDEEGDEALGTAADEVKSSTFCGGIAGFACPEGQVCVDDPHDGCSPKRGGADCGGVCKDVHGGNGKGACKNDDPSKTYVGTPEECQVIKFACAEGSVYFSDACGCGCQTP